MDTFQFLLLIKLFEKLLFIFTGCFLSYLGYKHRELIILKFPKVLDNKPSNLEFNLRTLLFKLKSVDPGTIFFVCGIIIIIYSINQKMEIGQFKDQNSGLQVESFHGLNDHGSKVSTEDLIKVLNGMKNDFKIRNQLDAVNSIDNLQNDFAEIYFGEEKFEIYLDSLDCVRQQHCDLSKENREIFMEINGWLNAKY